MYRSLTHLIFDLHVRNMLDGAVMLTSMTAGASAPSHIADAGQNQMLTTCTHRPKGLA